MKKYLLVFAAVITFISCQKESGPQEIETNPPASLNGGVIVLNEGAYNANNASLSYRDEDGQVSHNVYQSINGKILGDVLQSYTQTESSIYLVLNNSQKIEKISSISLKSEWVSEGYRSPRYLLELEDRKSAWVSNLKLDSNENEIDIVNLETGKRTSSIQVSGWCEQMLRVGSIIYIANTGKNELIITDGKNIKTVDLPPQPIDIVQDATGSIWILCTGGFVAGQAALCKYNPVNGKVESIMRFSNSFAFPSKLKINAEGSEIYFIEGGIYKMSISDTEIPSGPFISSIGTFYGLGVQPESGDIYVGDAADFQTEGQVHVFSKNGVLLESFASGYVPSEFIFR